LLQKKACVQEAEMLFAIECKKMLACAPTRCLALLQSIAKLCSERPARFQGDENGRDQVAEYLQALGQFYRRRQIQPYDCGSGIPSSSRTLGLDSVAQIG
jgi:hypothetical protein